MQKPYKIIEIKTEKDVELVDNLFTILFSNVQGKGIKTFEFTTTGVWVTAGSVGEKELVFAINTVDGVRLYTKIAGNLKYIAFT